MARKGITMNSMSDIFNSASVSEKEKVGFKVKFIDIDKIEPNERNEYSIEEIDELALSISLVGIRQNLEVAPVGEDKYKLISGERRYTAVKRLVEEDGREDLRKLPCVVINPAENIQMEIPDDIKELWLLTTTNSQRNKTDADRLVDIRNQKLIYQALLDAGVELNGKQRNLIAEALKMSPSTVQRYEFVDKNLSPELKAGFEDNKIPLTVAVEIAKQDEDNQKELAKKLETTGKITQADVNEVTVKAEKKKSKTASADGYESYIITQKDFEYLKELNVAVDGIGEGTTITGAEHDKLVKAQEKIKAQQQIISKILESAIKKHK